MIARCRKPMLLGLLLPIAPACAHAQGAPPTNPWAVKPPASSRVEDQSAFTQGYLRGFEQGYRRGADQAQNRSQANPEVAHSPPPSGAGAVKRDWPPTQLGIGGTPPPAVLGPTGAIETAGTQPYAPMPQAGDTRSYGEYPPLQGFPGQLPPAQTQTQTQLAVGAYGQVQQLPPRQYAPAQPPPPAYPQAYPYAYPGYPVGVGPSTLTNPYGGLGVGVSPYGLPAYPLW